MGNNQSNAAKSPAEKASSASSPASNASPSARRDPRGRDQFQSQRVAAPPEPSTAQAQGTLVSHRTRPSTKSHSHPHHAARLEEKSPSPKDTTKPLPMEKPKVEVKEEPSKPVAVPEKTASSSHNEYASVKSPFSFTQHTYDPGNDDGGFTRPPRLPLPIQEEVHTPGSPIIAPADDNAPVLNMEEFDNDVLPRRSSGLSNATGDEASEDEELPIDKNKASVPVVFKWDDGKVYGKVYVTGSIFQWSRKAKMHATPANPAQYLATLYVRPGTHHVRFLVDGEMTVSHLLPTTVDFGNNLVNYIEVNADDVPKEADKSQIEAMGTPVVEGEKQLEGQEAGEAAPEEEKKAAPKRKAIDPNERYTKIIPQYLVDLDKSEDTPDYQNVAIAIEKLPTPPSLPGFLGKPILNAATPMKDDNSVLNMPNHTVLNHLATSSIKNNVLAVSATTRYRFKRGAGPADADAGKYVTTIMYKSAGID